MWNISPGSKMELLLYNRASALKTAKRKRQGDEKQKHCFYRM